MQTDLVLAHRGGFVLQAQPGLGFDLRRWITQRSSFDFSLGAVSFMRWNSQQTATVAPTPNGDGSITSSGGSDQWIPPDTWRVGMALGYTHTLADTVTLHLSLRFAQNLLYEGSLPDFSVGSTSANYVLSVGSVQTLGLRPTPLLRVHIRDWVSLNADVSVHFLLGQETVKATYLAGASFVW